MCETRQENEPASAILCKACGVCCTGHIFVTADLEPAEIETTQALGLNVLQSHPDKPVFRLPCPLWKGQCTIYTYPHKPSICGDFRCKLLREILDGQLQLNEALTVVQRAKQLIQELEGELHDKQVINFRRRLFEYVSQLERSTSHTEAGNTFRMKAGVLLVLFAQRFGVTGLFNTLEQEQSPQR